MKKILSIAIAMIICVSFCMLNGFAREVDAVSRSLYDKQELRGTFQNQALQRAVSVEVSKTHTMADGVKIAIHYYPEKLKSHYSDGDKHADKILKHGIKAYKEIVYAHGFDTPGFTFALPDKDYCYDEDKTIDIYLKQSTNAYYEIIEGKGKDYDALVIFPIDIRDDEQIRASLYKEFFHIISYSYNKNLEPWRTEKPTEWVDWYVGGLAKYFGHLNNLKPKKYSYSVFWAYLHKKYGMEKIEEISRKLRAISGGGIKEELPFIISSTLNNDLEDIIKGFALTIYFMYFDPGEHSENNRLTVISLDDISDGDKRQLSSQASNVITLDLDKESTPKAIAFKKAQKPGALKMTIFASFKDGKVAELRKVTLDESDRLLMMELEDMKDNGIKELVLIITNTSPDSSMGYEILRH